MSELNGIIIETSPCREGGVMLDLKSIARRFHNWRGGYDYDCSDAIDDVEALLAALKDARKVLEFYANEKNWPYYDPDDGHACDGGTKARGLLKKWGKK